MTSLVIDSPLGKLLVEIAADGSLVAVDYTDSAALLSPSSDVVGIKVADQLQEFFQGGRRVFDLDICFSGGTDFQRQVWSLIADIPFGETKTYGDLARALGRPGASRAVGAACGRNPISIVVPCHRVVGCGNKLTGYAGGLERKKWLLSFENGLQLAKN